jgi:hypothetical protein
VLETNLFSRVLAAIFLACIFPLHSAIAQVGACTDALVVDLIAGQHTDAGDVTVCNDSNNLYVHYATVEGWTMTETHLAVEKGLDLIPQTHGGNPKIGHFTYRRTYIPSVQEDTFVISLAEAGFKDGDNLVIAAHAVTQLTDTMGNLIEQETGWGDGASFPGQSWATYISYTVTVSASNPPNPPD